MTRRKNGKEVSTMRRICLFLILAVLSTALGGCFFRPRKSVKPVDRPGGTAMIEGQVVDDAYRPLPGASVSVMGMEQIALTGPDGNYVLSGLMGGTQNVIVRKERYLTGVIALDLTPTAGRILSTAPVLRLLSTEGSLHMDSARIPSVPGKGPCAQCHQLHNPTDYLPAGGKNDSCYKASCHIATKDAGRFPDRSVFDASPHRLSVWPGQTGSPGNCGSCHEPHGIVNTPVMLRLGQTITGKRSTNDLCYACHANAGSGNADGWPGKAAYINSTNNKHYTIVDPSNKYVNGDCQICHVPHGKTFDGVNYEPMTRAQGYLLCASCHPGKAASHGGHGDCTICHDPHDTGTAAAPKVKNPATGARYTVTKASYRTDSGLLPDSYCQSCHKTPAPAGYTTAKDPLASTTSFKNSSLLAWQGDSNLHNVHVNRVWVARYDPAAGWYHGVYHYGYEGDNNRLRCNQCHRVHQRKTGDPVLPSNLAPKYVSWISRPYSGGVGSSKAGCGVQAGCHTCEWCHSSPGNPARTGTQACWDCGWHGYAAHSGVDY